MTRGLHAAERSLRVEEQLMLGGKKSLTLVSCDGRRYLLAASGEAITPLIEVCPPREVHPRRAERRRYRDRPLRSSTIAVANGDGVASGFCDALAARAGRPDVEERL
jgi:flagellar biogenesis protein FliO